MALDFRQTDSAREIAKLLLNTKDRSSFIVAKAHLKSIKDDVEAFLRGEINGKMEFKEIVVSPDNPWIPETLLKEHKNAESKTVFFVHGLDEIAQAQDKPENKAPAVFNILNFQREQLSENGVSFILWVSESTLEKIMEKAPDFWRFRDLFADFDSADTGMFSPDGIFISETTPFGDQNIEQLEKSLKIKLRLLEETVKRGQEKTKTALKLYSDIGYIYNLRSQYDKALDYYQKSLKIQVEIGDRNGEGGSLNNIGMIYKSKGEYDKALDYYQKSLKIQVEIGDRNGEGTTLNNIGLIYKSKGEYDKALDYYQKSLKIQVEIGDRNGEGTTLNNIAGIYYSKGEYDKALDYFQKSLKIKEEIGDRNGEGGSLNNIGMIYKSKGEYDKALDYFQKSLKIQVEIGDRNGEGTTLNNIAGIYYSKGEYDKALDYFQKSLKIKEEIGDRNGEGGSLNNIGLIYKSKDEYDKALDYFQKSLKIKEEIGDRNGEGVTLNNIAGIYYSKGEYDKALDYLQKSLKIKEEIGDKGGRLTTLFNVSRIYIEQKSDVKKGMPLLIEAYQTAIEIGDAMGIFQTSFFLGRLHTSNNKKKEALNYLYKAIEFGSKMGLPEVKNVDSFIRSNFSEDEIKAFKETQEKVKTETVQNAP